MDYSHLYDKSNNSKTNVGVTKTTVTRNLNNQVLEPPRPQIKNQPSGLNSSQDSANGNNQNGSRYTTKYLHPDWVGIRDPVPLLQRHSIGVLVDEILNANSHNQYTGLLIIGKSGSGKTTLCQTLAHRLHEKFPYTIKWFKKKDIQNFVKIVKSLPHTPHVLIFQDASYAMNGLTDLQIEEIAAQLTFIRHNTKARIIVIIQIHYSKAIEKFFRDTDITICTSITDNERTNMQQLFGAHNSGKVNQFIKIYHDQLFKSYFSVSKNAWTRKQYDYRTDDPFRAALVASIGSCHKLLYPREVCGICTEDAEKKNMTSMPAEKVLEIMKNAAAPSVSRSALNTFIFTNKGRKVLNSNIAAMYNTFTDLDHDYKIDWDEVLEKIKQDPDFMRRKVKKKYARKANAAKSEIEKKFSSYEVKAPEEQKQASSILLGEIPQVDPPKDELAKTIETNENQNEDVELEDFEEIDPDDTAEFEDEAI